MFFSGLNCKTAAAAVTISATSSCTASEIVCLDSSPLVIVLLLHDTSPSIPEAGCCRALLDSLSRIGPAVLPPRSCKTKLTIRCIPCSPPVCVVFAHLENAAAAAAIVRPDLVVLLPCSTPDPSSTVSVITKLQYSLPALPVLHPSFPHPDAVALCRALAADSGADWQQVALSSIACARSVRYNQSVRPSSCLHCLLHTQHAAACHPGFFSARHMGWSSSHGRRRCRDIRVESMERSCGHITGVGCAQRCLGNRRGAQEQRKVTL